MKRNFNFKGLAVMAVAALFAFSCEKNDEDNLLADRDGMNIVETAQDTDALSSLVAALVQADAGLVTALSDETETYTVFAPTNQAFTALLAGLD
ncbi:MAG: fasciclin domain-containing protein, partial [Flavobacteriaceae bacterium]